MMSFQRRQTWRARPKVFRSKWQKTFSITSSIILSAVLEASLKFCHLKRIVAS